ncbi:hypothetical protein PR202_gb26172 [Eleusine coracana subsp. coracana]|uniref:Retrotransposon gag domain-containing protein n=1 Tax=Eleusine coracana subsp. coracana TaxID=191504 RepID=A0AAV5FNG5_ELECO|nr:hypothetical protein PR202_gb26144 [Eleusine coracana subsp. coracana]GJN37241.1 hypothetical protein PR202_gb26172 [Eleusine coracana subsp. coracana]
MDEIPSTLTMKNTLGTTDTTRKNIVIGERTTDGTTDKRTIKIFLQETTTMTVVDAMIKFGVITMIMTIGDVVMTMTLTNPREWLQLYSTAIRSAGDDSYVMANYLPVCLDPTVRIWLTSLLEESIMSWGNLNGKLIESFQATGNRPGNHFDLTRIKQKTDEPLRDYIK